MSIVYFGIYRNCKSATLSCDGSGSMCSETPPVITPGKKGFCSQSAALDPKATKATTHPPRKSSYGIWPCRKATFNITFASEKCASLVQRNADLRIRKMPKSRYCTRNAVACVSGEAKGHPGRYVSKRPDRGRAQKLNYNTGRVRLQDFLTC